MTMRYEQALTVQRANEQRLLALPGVCGVGVKLRDGRLALVVDVDPAAQLPPGLAVEQIDGLDLLVERNKYELQ